jgi:hypothetical protein
VVIWNLLLGRQFRNRRRREHTSLCPHSRSGPGINCTCASMVISRPNELRKCERTSVDPAESRSDRFCHVPPISAAGAALRVHAQLQIARTAGISGDSPRCPKPWGLDGGRRSLRRTPLRPELCFSTDQKWAINRKSVNFTLRLIFRTLWSKFRRPSSPLLKIAPRT